MRVVVEAELFRTDHLDDVHHANLLALFHLGKMGPHTIEVEPRNDPRFRAWLDAEGIRTRQMCELAIEQAQKRLARRRKRKIHVARVDRPSWQDLRLPLDVALRVLKRPLVLLLENTRNDRNFLETITRLFPGFDLRKRIEQREIDVQTAGGSDNKMWLENRHRTPEELARLWVLSDSDSRRPWRDAGKEMYQHLSSSARELSQACAKHHVPLHVLTRRSIENYLPLALLYDWSCLRQEQRNTLYDAFTKLSPAQRHHYKVKDGFAQDRKDAAHAQKVGDLYEGVPEEVMTALDRGFGDKIAELFTGTPIFIQETWLEKDSQREEAIRIVESILEHL